ncbi:hypothetical protein RHGRI_035007 [Rhododendron griersonianum]|uniref:RING-type domain-containing protein n=1 Tax=Rhododendron griersonianum TaxID=479676 RepID=A0AAV6I306_9ERIC|nr:hypothetical protein RHGRI_035007 [Rhododendron griersonianum]
MMDYYQLAATSSYQDSLKVIEADIQHANVLAASIYRAKGSACFQMKLVYNHFAPILWFLLQWMDCSCAYMLPGYLNLFHVVVYKVSPDGKAFNCSHGRRATIREFYGQACTRILLSAFILSCFVHNYGSNIAAVILPSLQQLHENTSEVDLCEDEDHVFEMIVQKRLEEKSKKHSDVDFEREDECGICLEPCTKMVLPNCCHAMCNNCYRDWNMRSASCPFCRGSLKRVSSGDLWVLTCNGDVVDAETASKEEILRFHLFVNSLPKEIPDALFLMYYEYLI